MMFNRRKKKNTIMPSKRDNSRARTSFLIHHFPLMFNIILTINPVQKLEWKQTKRTKTEQKDESARAKSLCTAISIVGREWLKKFQWANKKKMYVRVDFFLSVQYKTKKIWVGVRKDKMSMYKLSENFYLPSEVCVWTFDLIYTTWLLLLLVRMKEYLWNQTHQFNFFVSE